MKYKLDDIDISLEDLIFQLNSFNEEPGEIIELMEVTDDTMYFERHIYGLYY